MHLFKGLLIAADCDTQKRFKAALLNVCVMVSAQTQGCNHTTFCSNVDGLRPICSFWRGSSRKYDAGISLTESKGVMLEEATRQDWTNREEVEGVSEAIWCGDEEPSAFPPGLAWEQLSRSSGFFLSLTALRGF